MDENYESPIGQYEVTIIQDADFAHATIFAVLDEDGETGDSMYTGMGRTISDALIDLANILRETP